MIKSLGNYLEFNSYFYKNFLKILEHNIRNKNKEIKKPEFWSFTFALCYRQNGHFADYETFQKKWPPKRAPTLAPEKKS